MRKSVLTVAILSVFLVFVFTPRKAEAISAWAKKYNLECSTCHSGGGPTKLTPVGVEFLRRGHRMNDDEASTDLSKLVSINTKLRFNDSNAAGRNSSFEVHALSLYTGGVLSNHFSYFTEMYLYENTGRTTGAVNSDLGRGKLADAYLMYNSSPGKSSYTTVKFGQVSPSQLLIYWNVGPRYSETRPYIVNNSTVAPNTYRPFLRNFGVEVAQTVNDFHGAFGVLNGTGSGVTNSVDNNSSKDIYGTADYVLDNQGSAVGVYGYKGKGLVTPSTGASWENEFNRVGAFGQLSRGQLNLTGVFTKGEEQITSAGVKSNNKGLLAEVDWTLNDKWVAFGRYDYFDANVGKDSDELSGPVFGSTYQLLDSGRAIFEYHKQGKAVTSGSKPWEYRVEVSFMF